MTVLAGAVVHLVIVDERGRKRKRKENIKKAGMAFECYSCIVLQLVLFYIFGD